MIVTKEHFIEGLSRLAENVKLIDYYKTEWHYADHVAKQTSDMDARLNLPELATWRTFSRDLCDEIKAASEIGRNQFQTELENCVKLAIALEIGHYRDGSQLILDAVAEIETAVGRLRTTQHDTKDDTAKKPKKIRKMNTKAADCARRYRADKGQTPLKTVVSDYIDELGGSVESIMRVLADNPDQWKDDTKTT